MNRRRNIFPIGFAVALLFALPAPAALFAQPDAQAPDSQAIQGEGRAQIIEWRPVGGASGYLVQIRNDEATLVRETELAQPRFETRLPPGEYSLRVAALNVFGRPSSFTDWYKFRVLSIEEERRLAEGESASQDADEDDAGASDAGQRGISVRSKEPPPPLVDWSWPAFVPGYAQWRRDQVWRSAAWWTLFAGVAGYGWSEMQAGNDLADQAGAQLPLFPLLAQSGQSGGLLLLLTERSNLRAQYDRAQNNQRLAGVAFLALYALQVYDAVYLSPQAAARSAAASSRKADSAPRFQTRVLYGADHPEHAARGAFGAGANAQAATPARAELIFEWRF